MLNSTSLIAWTTSVLFAFFSFFLYHGTRRPSTRMFAVIGANCSLWALAHGFLYFLGSAPDPEPTYALRLFLMRANHWLGTNTGIIFIYLSFFYPEQIAPAQWIRNALAAIALSIGSVYLFTSSLIQSISPSESTVLQYTWIFGPLEPFFYVHFIGSFLLAAGHLLYKYKKTTKEEVRRDIRRLLAAIAGGCIPIVITTILLTASGNFEISRFAPTLTALGIGFTVLVITRYHILSIRILFTELLMGVLILILFANVFIPELSVLTSSHSPLLFINRYTVVNWALGVTLLVAALRGMRKATDASARSYMMIVGVNGLWALSVGFSYFTSDPTIYELLVPLNLYLTNSLAFAVALFAIRSTQKAELVEKIIPRLFGLHLILGFFYFGTDLFFKEAYLAPVLSERSWSFGDFGIIPRIYSVSLLLGGFWLLFQQLSKNAVAEIRAKRTAFFWTFFITAFPSFILTLVVHTGYTSLYWLTPLTTMGSLFVSLYVIRHTDSFPIQIVIAELGVVFTILILFGNIFSGGELSSSFISKALVFIAFTTVGIFFIRNIIKGEEQKEQLDRLSITLSDLNKNLKAKVLERTRELAEEQSHLETILENLTNGLIEYDTHGTIVRMNEAAEKMLGVKRRDALGQQIPSSSTGTGTLATLAHIAHPDSSARTIREATAADPSRVYEVALRDHVEKELQISTLPVLSNDMPEGTLLVIRDVTRENLISKSKSEFISIAAHQLRSPLSVIKWTFSSLLSGDMGRLPLSLETAMHQGSESNQRMINLVNDLLIATRIEGEKFDYHFDKTDAKEIIETAVREATPKAQEKIITLELLGTARATKTPIWADKEKLLIALANILSNAIWYTPPGGTISVKLVSGKELVSMSIKDTGIGIPKAEQERLFSKFYRSNDALRMNPNGSGLGLYITQNILAAHQGTVEISSTEGKGTTVTLSMKAHKESTPNNQ